MLPSIPLPPGAPPLAEHLALILAVFRREIVRRMPAHPARHGLLALVSARITALVVRFAKLAIRAAEGRATPRTRPPRPPSPGPAPARPTRQRLPAGHAWLTCLVPEAQNAAAQLTQLLNQPEMKTLLQAAPQAEKMLRPLCRMLGVPWQGVTVIDLRPRPRSRPIKPPADPKPAEPPASLPRYRRPWWMPPGKPWRHLIPDLRPTLDPASLPLPARVRRR